MRAAATRPDNNRRKQGERRRVPRGGRREADAKLPDDIARCVGDVPPLLLVVDDHRDGREMVAEYLAYLGYRVESAGTGEEALQKVETLQPALVVMDVLLPDGDGLDFIAKIRGLAMTPPPQIVVHTAAVIGDVRARARAANVDMFVSKPCDLKVLARQIRHLLLHDSSDHPVALARGGA